MVNLYGQMRAVGLMTKNDEADRNVVGELINWYKTINRSFNVGKTKVMFVDFGPSCSQQHCDHWRC